VGKGALGIWLSPLVPDIEGRVNLHWDGIGSKPLGVGVYVGQHLSFTRNGQTPEGF